MDIVYALTRNVYEWLLPSVRSLAEHNPEARVHILAEDDALPFSLPIEADVINISAQRYFPSIGEHRTEAFGGYINHLKVCYPLILECDTVLHLDIDTIVCDRLDGAWETDLSGKWFASVPEAQTWYRPYGDTYYNMGVSLLNLAQMRKDNAPELMTDYLLSENRPFADQDAWNRYGDKGTKLPLRYNESMVTGTTDDPAIIHYCAIPDWWTNKGMYRREYLERYKEER